MSLKQKVYNLDEREALLRGAVGHWAGGAARYLLHAGCSRAEVCKLRWRDLDGLARSHPLYAELFTRRRRAVEVAKQTGADPDNTFVFPNYYGQRMNPTTLNDRLREMLRRGEEMRAGGNQGRGGGDGTVHVGERARA